MRITRKAALRIMRWIVAFGISFFVIGIWFWYNKTSFFRVTSYEIRGVSQEESVLLERRLAEENNRVRFGFVSNNKVLTYTKKPIIKVVQEIVPDVASVTIHPSGFHQLTIAVTVLDPVFQLSLQEAVDGNGVVFMTKRDIGSLPRLVVATSTRSRFVRNTIMFEKLSIGTEELTGTYIAQLIEFKEKVSSVIFPVSTVEFTLDNDVVLYDARGISKVLFVRNADMHKVWSTLVSAIDTDPLKSKLLNEKDALRYLDVRFGNKVFYRFGVEGLLTASSSGTLGSHETASTSTIER